MIIGISHADEVELESAVAMYRIAAAHAFVDSIFAMRQSGWQGTYAYVLAEDILGREIIARGLSAASRFRNVEGICVSGVADENREPFAYMHAMKELRSICISAPSLLDHRTCLLTEARRIRAVTDAVCDYVSAYDAVSAAFAVEA